MNQVSSIVRIVCGIALKAPFMPEMRHTTLLVIDAERNRDIGGGRRPMLHADVIDKSASDDEIPFELRVPQLVEVVNLI